jgi:hypothetical protein
MDRNMLLAFRLPVGERPEDNQQATQRSVQISWIDQSRFGRVHPDERRTMTRRARTGELMWPRLFRRFDGGARTLQGQLRDMLVLSLIHI